MLHRLVNKNDSDEVAISGIDQQADVRTDSAALMHSTLAAATGLSSATLHEAAGKVGALPAGLKPLVPSMRVCGPALPIRCPSGDNLWIHRALALAKSGEVLIVDVGTGVEFGYWGEIMSTAAIARGIAGLVINGGVRDSQALIALGLPIFSAMIAIRGTAKDPTGDGAIGEPVRIGEVVVHKGDLIVGDADGLVVLAPAQAELAVAAAIDREIAEAAILERLRAGALTLDIYDL
jgi:4-hydroxy-4-methyl-2-oxoglutarate aldolase